MFAFSPFRRGDLAHHEHHRLPSIQSDNILLAAVPRYLPADRVSVWLLGTAAAFFGPRNPLRLHLKGSLHGEEWRDCVQCNQPIIEKMPASSVAGLGRSAPYQSTSAVMNR
jgi:hypothetical protein